MELTLLISFSFVFLTNVETARPRRDALPFRLYAYRQTADRRFAYSPPGRLHRPGSGVRKKMVDYLSLLPDELIYEVLSRLPMKDIVRTSILSKHWHDIWLSYPNFELHFDFCMCDGHFMTRNGDRFLNFIENCVDQCLSRKESIENFNLSICFPDIQRLTAKLNRWLDFATERNVSKLTLRFGRSFDFIPHSQVLYSIHKEVLNAKKLVVLDLSRCNLEEGSVNLPCLAKLSLTKCLFADESLMQDIVNGCPAVEQISIVRCIGVGHFLNISCKPHLKSFKVDRCKQIEKIGIDAPSLHQLSYSSSNKTCAIHMSTWSTAKQLELGRAMISQLEYFLPKFQCLEELRLSNGQAKKLVKISSSTLKRLVLQFGRTFPKSKIEAPNLHTLEFSPARLSSKFKFASWNVPKLENIDMIFSVRYFNKAYKAGLGQFLMKLPSYGDLKMVMSDYEDFVMIEKLHAVSFSSLRNMVNRSDAKNILISSGETRLAQMLGDQEIKGATTIYMACSSPEAAEAFCKEIGYHPIIRDSYQLLQMVAPEVLEIKMTSALRRRLCRAFKHHAGLILHRKKVEDTSCFT
nr:putative F-box/LRR-repeat protein At4g15060 [Ipomoea trifida]